MWIRWISEDFAYVPMQWIWMDLPLLALSCATTTGCAMLGMWLARRAMSRPTSPVWQAAAALCLAASVWNAHFIGLQAYALCAAGDAPVAGSLLACVPALAGAAWLVHALTRPQARRLQVCSGVLAWTLTSAIAHAGTLHATASSHFMEHALPGVLVALAIQLSLTLAATTCLLRSRGAAGTLLSGVLAGFGASAMHLVTMGATFVPVGPDPQRSMPLESSWTPVTRIGVLSLCAGWLLYGLWQLRQRCRPA